MHGSRKRVMVYLKRLPQTSPVQTWENSHRGKSHAWQQKKGYGTLEDITPDFTSADLRKQNEEAVSKKAETQTYVPLLDTNLDCDCHTNMLSTQPYVQHANKQKFCTESKWQGKRRDKNRLFYIPDQPWIPIHADLSQLFQLVSMGWTKRSRQ